MRAVGVPAQARPQQRRDGRRGPRGPRGGNLDEVIEQGEAIVSDLLTTPYDERDYRTLTKANLEKMYVLLTREWQIPRSTVSRMVCARTRPAHSDTVSRLDTPKRV